MVLLALEPANWAHLVVTSPDESCAASLESIRQASLELLSSHPPGNPPPLQAPQHNDADWTSAKLQGDNVRVANDVESIAKETPDDHRVAVQGGSESSGASKVDQCASNGDGGTNSIDQLSLSSGCVLAGLGPITTPGGGTSDGVASSACAGREIQSPADAAG